MHQMAEGNVDSFAKLSESVQTLENLKIQLFSSTTVRCSAFKDNVGFELITGVTSQRHRSPSHEKG